MVIAERSVGPGQPCLIIAEAGVNHNGDMALARRLIDAAAEAGADAVKFQTFKAERLASASAPKAAYQWQATDRWESQREMLRRLELSESAHRGLMVSCQQRGILFLSSAFEEESADLLERLGVCAFKIPSGELTNLRFLEHVAQKGKPMIVSTGMSTLSEVEQAVQIIRRARNDQLILLHCVSDYPANPSDANLRAMHTMAEAFNVPVGYSDHTPGVDVALAAVALGACVIEKHFTLDRALPGPDHRASLEPNELRQLVEGIRRVEAALGHGRKEPAQREAPTAAVARKSLVAARDIPAGSLLTETLIVAKRPGTGLPPALLPQLVGRKTVHDIPAGALLTLDMVAS
ncbi:MAG: N-acetylneuraminate synthase [Candidatus Omnitrophica bacterium]|nr:N-acetylneuraminate synthase [Candidatus Omnitrophota bacterium]